MTEEEPERGDSLPGAGESDQLPEEAPPGQIVEDKPGEGREDAHESPGGAGDEDLATGHPDEE